MELGRVRLSHVGALGGARAERRRAVDVNVGSRGWREGVGCGW